MARSQRPRVIELAERVTGEYCGKLLADFGLEVIKIENPVRGSPTRKIDAPSRGIAGALFEYLNTNKKSVALDLGSEDGRKSLARLLLSADVIIDDHDPAWAESHGVSPAKVGARYPSLIQCAISPFGYDAPSDLSCLKSLNVFHAGGWGLHTPSYPDPDRPPLKGPGRYLVDFEAAIDAATCILSALLWRDGSGLGQFIDVSEQEVMVSRADTVIGRILAGEIDASPGRNAFDQAGPRGFYKCADGAVYLYMTSRQHWLGLKELMGNPDWAKAYDDDWLEFNVTDEAVGRCRSEFQNWVVGKLRDEVSAEGQRLNLPLVPVNDASDLHDSPQFQYRGFFQVFDHPVHGKLRYPTVPYKLSASPVAIGSTAPLLGEDTDRVLAEAASFDGGSFGPVTERPGPTGGPLSGIRVVEITKVWAGPYGGKMLAFLGAEVIKVESMTNLDEMRAYGGGDIDNAPYFLSLNPEVKSVQINMKNEQGLTVLRDLLSRSDVLLNNIRPNAMERLGLGYDELRKIKSDLISVSIKMYGNEGPLGYQTGYAPCFAALGGLNSLVGYDGELPVGMSTRYGDSTVGAMAALATVAALVHRQNTGEGQFVDLSAVEAMASMIGDSLLGFEIGGVMPKTEGNRHSSMAPHGCYRCRGGDWISVAVETDAEWRRLCDILGRDSLAREPRFSTLAQRQANLLALDRILGELVSDCDAVDLALRLRSGGVAAHKSMSTLDLVSDEHLWARNFYRFVTDGSTGSRPVLGPAWRMSRTIAPIVHGAPRLGEHNDYVYRELLGYSDEQYTDMIEQGVVN